MGFYITGDTHGGEDGGFKKFSNSNNHLMKNLNDSVDDTRKYKDQIAQLSSNLESLNTIYGNMLNAMRK